MLFKMTVLQGLKELCWGMFVVSGDAPLHNPYLISVFNTTWLALAHAPTNDLHPRTSHSQPQEAV